MSPTSAVRCCCGEPSREKSLAMRRAAAPADPFRPSDYTGLLMHALRQRAGDYRRGSGLDMGVGSGVLLATMGRLGRQSPRGGDIDPDALHATEALLHEMGLTQQTTLLQG